MGAAGAPDMRRLLPAIAATLLGWVGPGSPMAMLAQTKALATNVPVITA